MTDLQRERVGEPLFATCANQEVDVRDVLGQQVLLEDVEVDVGGLELVALHVGSDTPRRVREVEFTAVVERDEQIHAVAPHRLPFDGVDCIDDHLRNPRICMIADDTHTNVVLVGFVAELAEVPHREVHEERDLMLRTLPVVFRERKGNERLDAHLLRRLDSRTERVGACFVTKARGPTTIARPPAVAVHDDGNNGHIVSNLHLWPPAFENLCAPLRLRDKTTLKIKSCNSLSTALPAIGLLQTAYRAYLKTTLP